MRQWGRVGRVGHNFLALEIKELEGERRPEKSRPEGAFLSSRQFLPKPGAGSRQTTNPILPAHLTVFGLYSASSRGLGRNEANLAPRLVRAFAFRHRPVPLEVPVGLGKLCLLPIKLRQLQVGGRGQLARAIETDDFEPRLFGGVRMVLQGRSLSKIVQGFDHLRAELVGALEFGERLARASLLKQYGAEAPHGFTVAWAELDLGAKFRFGLVEIAGPELQQTQRQVDAAQVRAQVERLVIFAFGVRDLLLREVTLRHELVGARRFGAGRNQPVERLLRKKPGGFPEVEEQIGVVGLLLQGREKRFDGLRRAVFLGQGDTQEIQPLGPLEVGDGLSGVTPREERLAQHAVGLDRVRLELEGAAQFGDGAVVIALLLEGSGALQVRFDRVRRWRRSCLQHQTNTDQDRGHGSFTFKTWSAGTCSIACVFPLGQRTSTVASRAEPNPKCRVLSFAER